MVTLKELLLETLEDLTKQDFKSFKWHLIVVEDGFSPIKSSLLEDKDRQDTVNVIVQKYNQQAVEVTEKILGKIGRNDLAQRLSRRSLEVKGKLWKDNVKKYSTHFTFHLVKLLIYISN